MSRVRDLAFYNDFGKFREPPVEGLLINSEGANENLPFFVWHKEKRSCMQKTECITCGYGKKQVLVDVFKLKLGLGRLTIGLVFAKDDV